MSDEHAHNDGAHEVDKMPSGRLFNILFILGSLTLALCIGVIQLFNQQVRNIEGERVAGGYESQQEYVAEMDAVADGYGKYEIVKPGAEGEDGDSKPDQVTTRYFIPVEKAQQQLLDDPGLLSGSRPDGNWAQTGTGKKVEEWGGLPGPVTPKKPELKKLGKGEKPGGPAEPRDHRFAFTVSGDDLVLLGEAPTDEVSEAIEAAAKKTHFGDNVRNKLKVTGAPGKPGYDSAYERGLAAIDLMSTGTVKWTAGKLTVQGFVAEADQAKLDEVTGAPGTPMGTIELATTEAADACDEQFARTLRKPIAFEGEGEAGATQISDNAGKVLDKLAAIAKECPGRIMIDGHTHTDGDGAANKRLSLQRANAVSAALQERGLERRRLRAKGYGGERPLVEGAAGEKKNPRIELHIAR